MDFQRLKRKELQELCKKHHIPANSTNLEMVKNLAFLKVKEKPMVRGRSCLKDVSETLSENGSSGVVRQAKKVRFSPENETIEFVDSSTRRRKSITKHTTQKEGLVVNSLDIIEASREIGENQARITRSRAQKLVSGGVIAVLPVAEKKRKTVNATRSGSVEGDDVERGDVTNLSSGLPDHFPSENADAEETGLWVRRSLRNREVPISKKNEEGEKDRLVLKKNQTSLKNKDVERNNELSKDTGLGGEHKISQHDTSLRQSKRSVREVDDCGPLMGVSVENEVTGKGRMTRSKALLVDNASAPEHNMRTDTEIEVQGKLEVAVQLEEPTRHSGKNGARRKSVIPHIEELQNDGCRKQLSQLVLEGGTRSKKLEGNDMMPRRSTRNASVAVSDEKHWNDNRSRNNKPRKRKRDPILDEAVVTEGVTLDEEPPPTLSTWNAAKSATAVQRKKLLGKSKLPNLEQPEPLAERILAFKEPLIPNAKLSKQEIVESTVLNSRKHDSITATEDMNKFSEKCSSKEVCVETFAIEEVRSHDIVKLVEIGTSKSVKLWSDLVEIECLVPVSNSVVEEDNPL